jgi:outer membrane protein assembly factor BamB
VMIGRLVTNKGIKDLVFAASGTSDVYAVDPDLATLFWRRHFENVKIAKGPFLGYGENGNSNDDGDDDNDISMGIRPLYVAPENGAALALNAGSGADLADMSPEQGVCAGDLADKLSAKWQSAEGTKWSCSGNTQHGIDAFKGTARIWSSQGIEEPVSVAVANGTVFVLANGHGKPVLAALDASTGRELYRSGGGEIEARTDSSALVIANGHVCFGDVKGTLYCFGFPVDL